MTENIGSYAQPVPDRGNRTLSRIPARRTSRRPLPSPRDEAANVGRSAAEAGGHVAQTAADQARR